MPQYSIHTKTANLENRDEFGKFIKVNHPISIPPPNTLNAPNSPNPPNTPLFSNLCHFVSKLSLKKVTVILAFISLIATNGVTLTIAEFFFPNSSPIFHRAIAHQGLLKTSGNGTYQLVLPNNSVYTIYLKPSPALNNLKTLNEVVVKGNLTWTPYVIENAEIYPLNISTP